MRLTAIILLPLLAIAGLIGVWAVFDAQSRAGDGFNRALLTVALAISRDVAASGGDALSADTTGLLRDTSGGRVFYHVFAPDGVFVTGFATPPVPTTETFLGPDGQVFYDGVHQSRSVRAVRFTETMQVDGLNGDFTTTVWQDQSLLRARTWEFSLRSLQVMALLIVTVALVVWFGVHLGLRPLLDLEAAIGRRSGSELSPIQRAVPVEVGGIVQTLNRLFGQVSRSMTAQNEFISNAAHQLKNPIAGVLSLAEAVDTAPTPEEGQRRARDLLTAARETADLSQKLLLLERAKSISPASAHQDFPLGAAVEAWVNDARAAAPPGVSVKARIAPELGDLHGDETMLREAIRNLIDNSFRHGGPGVTEVEVSAVRRDRAVQISVADNGKGIRPDAVAAVRDRFRQVADTSGSGLGVSIVEAVVQGHGGTMDIVPTDPGLCVVLTLPDAPD